MHRTTADINKIWFDTLERAWGHGLNKRGILVMIEVWVTSIIEGRRQNKNEKLSKKGTV